MSNGFINSSIDSYEILGVVGEGSFGTVNRCKSRTNGSMVAIKQFKDGDDIQAIALREIKMLKVT